MIDVPHIKIIQESTALGWGHHIGPYHDDGRFTVMLRRGRTEWLRLHYRDAGEVIDRVDSSNGLVLPSVYSVLEFLQ